MPPPGAGLTTVIAAVIGEAISEAEMAAVSCELLTNVVDRGLPFHATDEPDTKPVPVTVKENAAPPGVAESGCRGFRYGTGLETENAKLGSTNETNPAKTKRKTLWNTERFIVNAPLEDKEISLAGKIPTRVRLNGARLRHEQ